MKVDAQKPISVHYDRQVLGLFTADLLVNECLIVELKAKVSAAETRAGLSLI